MCGSSTPEKKSSKEDVGASHHRATMFTGTIRIKICEACGLRPTDFQKRHTMGFGKTEADQSIDPYVSIDIDERHLGKFILFDSFFRACVCVCLFCFVLFICLTLSFPCKYEIRAKNGRGKGGGWSNTRMKNSPQTENKQDGLSFEFNRWMFCYWSIENSLCILGNLHFVFHCFPIATIVSSLSVKCNFHMVAQNDKQFG